MSRKLLYLHHFPRHLHHCFLDIRELYLIGCIQSILLLSYSARVCQGKTIIVEIINGPHRVDDDIGYQLLHGLHHIGAAWEGTSNLHLRSKLFSPDYNHLEGILPASNDQCLIQRWPVQAVLSSAIGQNWGLPWLRRSCSQIFLNSPPLWKGRLIWFCVELAEYQTYCGFFPFPLSPSYSVLL